jgi:hypothetical protein
MHLLRSLRRRVRGRRIDTPTRIETEAEAKALASDRDSIRVSQAAGSVSGSSGLMTPTPELLRPHEDER